MRVLSLLEGCVSCFFLALDQLTARGLGGLGGGDRDEVLNGTHVPLVLLELTVELASTCASPSLGLVWTQPTVWRSVTPQLFARLCHPSAVVRHLVRLALARLGAANPYQLVFPLVVDMQSAKATDFRFKYGRLSELANEITWKSSLEGGATPSFDVIARQVETLVLELNRVADLGEDRWLALLRSVQSGMPSRLALLEREAAILGPDSTRVPVPGATGAARTASPRTTRAVATATARTRQGQEQEQQQGQEQGRR